MMEMNSEAAGKVDTGSEVLRSQVDGQNASEWVKEKALDYLYSYCYVNQKFNELGLSLDEDELDSVEYVTNNMWGYYKEPFENMGIAESSFREAYSTYNAKLSKLLGVMYGEGGELAKTLLLPAAGDGGDVVKGQLPGGEDGRGLAEEGCQLRLEAAGGGIVLADDDGGTAGLLGEGGDEVAPRNLARA